MLSVVTLQFMKGRESVDCDINQNHQIPKYLFILSDELPCKGSTKYEKELIITMNVPVDHMTHNRIFIEIF